VTRAVASVAEIPALVQAADRAGRDASPADDAAPLVDDYPHDDEWGAEPATTDVSIFAQLAPALGTAFRRWAERDQLLFGFAEHQMTSYFLGSSTGLRRRVDQPNGRLEVNGKTADYAGSAWAGLHTRDFADVDVAAIVTDLEQRLSWGQRRVELPAGRYETLLPPSAVADLLLDAYWGSASRDAEEGRSVFGRPGGGTRVGERIATLPLTLRSDPAAPGLQCAPFEIVSQSSGGLQSVFDNGAPVEPTDWVRAGTLTNLVRTRSWATRTGEPPRPLVDNLIVDGGGTATVEDMVARTERGLLLTCLWYIREVDPQTLLLTGLTRDGVYLVEDGQVTAAVNNFRFNESPIDLLGRASEVGRSEPTLPREWSDYFTRVSTPTMRVPDFHMSTVSQAS
ncbi:MAG: hypothetical protein QOD45_940, partial [Pseudonocardiales bacterium]|jgi:predicted Zn-dependent protease|nr:hypothetical protein [Pseudonocardiales bacterium]